MTTTTVDTQHKDRKQTIKAAASAWLGSALEYYDFFIYGTAAGLIFPRIMYDSSNPFMGNVMSAATFGVAYLIRPIGSFFMGWLGDKYGRKLVLFITLFGMGIATFLIGCLPTYAMVGGLAPVLLIILRMFQGFAVAGEQSSATTMVLEHSTDKTRGFWSSFTLGGTQLGFILATAVFLPFAALPDEILYGWAWRVPFWASVLVVALAWWVRKSVEETPEFEAQMEAAAAARKAEAAEAAKHEKEALEHRLGVAADDVPTFKWLGWFYLPNIITVMMCCLISVVSTVASLYALQYGASLGIPRPTILTMQILANVTAVFVIMGFGALSDRIGRRPVFLIAAVGCAIMIWPFIMAVAAKDIVMIFVWGILLSGVIYSAYSGSGMGMFSEQFETKVRVSGMAIATQFGFAIGGFAPAIINLLQGSVTVNGKTSPNLSNWMPAAIFTMVACLIAATGALLNRETARKPQSELGSKAALEAHALAAANAGKPLPVATEDHPFSGTAQILGIAGAILALVTAVVHLTLGAPTSVIPFVLTGIASVWAWNGAARAKGQIELGAPYRWNSRLQLGFTLGRIVGAIVVVIIIGLLIWAVSMMLAGQLKL